jgi:hypothetical protein
MSAQDDTYNGWTNRETWAVALHINNEQVWQECVYDRLSDVSSGREAGEIVKQQVEDWLLGDEFDHEAQRDALHDIGSLWRVEWDEIGSAFLADLGQDVRS